MYVRLFSSRVVYSVLCSVLSTAALMSASNPAFAATEYGWAQNPGFTANCPEAKPENNYACKKVETESADTSNIVPLAKRLTVQSDRRNSDDYKSQTQSIELLTQHLEPSCKEDVLKNIEEFDLDQELAETNQIELPSKKNALTKIFKQLEPKMAKSTNEHVLILFEKPKDYRPSLADVRQTLDQHLGLSRLGLLEKKFRGKNQQHTEGYAQVARLEKAKPGVHTVNFSRLDLGTDGTVSLETTILEVNNKKREGYMNSAQCREFWTKKVRKEGCTANMTVLDAWQKDQKIEVTAQALKKKPKACDEQLEDTILGCSLEQFVSSAQTEVKLPLAKLVLNEEGNIAGFELILPTYKDVIADLEKKAALSPQSRFQTLLQNLEGLDASCRLDENAAELTTSIPMEISIASLGLEGTVEDEEVVKEDMKELERAVLEVEKEKAAEDADKFE